MSAVASSSRLSVNSSSSSFGASSSSCRIAAIEPTRSGSENCLGDRLMATCRLPIPAAASCLLMWQAWRTTHLPMGMISPVSSATPMNWSGWIMPFSGWCQRSSASMPSSWPVFRQSLG
ncbi:hypothetical protein D3C86_1933670 [compost metagenome]